MIKILIVDDSNLICDTLKNMLNTQFDCELFIAHTKKETIGILRHHSQALYKAKQTGRNKVVFYK